MSTDLKIKDIPGIREIKLELPGIFRYSYPRYASVGIPASNTRSYLGVDPVFPLAGQIGFGEGPNLKIRMLILSGRKTRLFFCSKIPKAEIFNLPYFVFRLEERDPDPVFFFFKPFSKIQKGNYFDFCPGSESLYITSETN